MTRKHTSPALTLGLAAMLAAPLAMAQAQGGSWYVGGNVGRSAATIDDSAIRSGLIGQGLTSSTISDDDRDTGYKLFGGYELNPNFALEAGVFDLGRFGYTATTTPPGTLGGSIGVKGINLDLVGKVPVGAGFSVLGRAGVLSSRTRGSFAATGSARVPYSSATPSEHGNGYKYGAGLSYDFTPSLAMRVEAERFHIRDAVGHKGDFDLLSIGLVYRFGAAPPPVRTASYTPPPMPAPVVAPAPPPVVAPAPAPAPVRPAAMRVTLAAQSLFGFDQTALKPEGRQLLDELVGKLRNVSFDTIQVTGHTDRLGTAGYNEKLSERRAQAVRNYLAQAGSIPSSKIVATGRGERDPVTKPGDCKGTKQTTALVACLQPDRRVDVEVTGMR